MLSRLALRGGAFTPVLRSELQKRAAIVVVSRSSSGTNKVIEDWDRANKLYYGPERDMKNFSPPVQSAFTPVLRSELQKRAAIVVVSRSSSGTNKVIEDWDRANKLYYGPERDMKNFPPPVQSESPPPVRMGCIPDSWFQFFYEKTGVTGPYVFGLGTLTFLLSKEIWVIEHGFMEFITFWAMFTILTKKLGPGMAKYFDSQTVLWRAKYWDGPMTENKKTADTSVAEIEKAIWREDGQKYLYEAKKENVDLQLESIYRQRLAEVSQAIKSRLNYQMDVEGTKRRFEQKHMVNWIVDSVVKGITPDQEKQALLKCIEDLNKLSTKVVA